MEMRSDIGVKSLQAKEHQRLQRNPRKPQKHEGRLGRCSLTASEGISPTNALTSDSQPPEMEDNTFLLFMPPSLGFVVASANEYTKHIGNQSHVKCNPVHQELTMNLVSHPLKH